MPSISNGNLIVLKWQNIHVILNIKYTAYIYIYIYIYIEREREREREREKEQNMTKQFTLHSAAAYSEPFTTSKAMRLSHWR